jgi:hypothetical protein
MADLAWEFGQAVALAWLCFGFGVVLFRMGCKDRHCQILSRGLLFLSPFVLTCFGVHATRENQQLAAILAARKSESVSERVFLASVTRTDLGDGCHIERECYTDGRQTVRLKMQTGIVGTQNSHDSLEANAETPGDTGERIVRVPAWHQFSGFDSEPVTIDGRTELLRTF